MGTEHVPLHRLPASLSGRDVDTVATRDRGDDDRVSFDDDPIEILAVDEALKRLEAERPRLAEVVVLRFFAGLTGDEAAEALGVSPRTVDADWRLAKAWLHRALEAE